MPELAPEKESDVKGPEHLMVTCSKYARKTHNLNKKLAVYKICNETLLNRKKDDYQSQEPLSPGSSACESPLLSRKKKKWLKKNTERPSNALRTMILTDANKIERVYGWDPVQKTQRDEFSKWLTKDNKLAE